MSRLFTQQTASPPPHNTSASSTTATMSRRGLPLSFAAATFGHTPAPTGGLPHAFLLPLLSFRYATCCYASVYDVITDAHIRHITAIVTR